VAEIFAPAVDPIYPGFKTACGFAKVYAKSDADAWEAEEAQARTAGSFPQMILPAAPEAPVKRENEMKSYVTAVFAGAVLATTGGIGMAHHSFAMFDQANPIDLVGVVKEWKYTAPHVFIVLQVKEADGTTQVWNLEGNTPGALARDGWTAKTLKPGDELSLKIDPLRSGAPGGAFNVSKVTFKDGSPIVATQH
jgi:hypothetical protein